MPVRPRDAGSWRSPEHSVSMQSEVCGGGEGSDSTCWGLQGPCRVMWGPRSHRDTGLQLGEGRHPSKERRAGARAPPPAPGLSNAEAAFSTARALFYLQLGHLCVSMSVQSEKAAGQQGHCCDSIHYNCSPGPIGLCVFNLQLEVPVACWGLSCISQQCLPRAP